MISHHCPDQNCNSYSFWRCYGRSHALTHLWRQDLNRPVSASNTPAYYSFHHRSSTFTMVSNKGLLQAHIRKMFHALHKYAQQHTRRLYAWQIPLWSRQGLTLSSRLVTLTRWIRQPKTFSSHRHSFESYQSHAQRSISNICLMVRWPFKSPRLTLFITTNLSSNTIGNKF